MSLTVSFFMTNASNHVLQLFNQVSVIVFSTLLVLNRCLPVSSLGLSAARLQVDQLSPHLLRMPRDIFNIRTII